MKYWEKIKDNPPTLESLATRVDHKPAIKFEPVFYDSETSKETHIEKKGKKTIEVVDDTWVYLWAVGIGGELYYGRFLHEFIELIKWMITYYNISPSRLIDIWIHNASYDISYMYDLLLNLNGGPEGISTIWASTQKLISWNMENLGITIKCSYRLTNRSLDKWCKDLGIERAKQTGTKSYNTKYKPWDKLPRNEYKYMAYDILSLHDCFFKEIELQGYNFANCPLTQTGFVRKDFQREYIKKGEYFKNHKKFAETQPTDSQYDRLERAAMGGMVAGNYKLLGEKIIHEMGIGHLDFASHYPTQQKIRNFAWKPKTILEEGDESELLTFDDLDYFENTGHFYVVDIVLGTVKLKKDVTMPFMCASKVTKGANSKIYATNGKITAIRGEGRITCSNLDLKIYRDQYDIKWYSIIALDVYTIQRLPEYMQRIIDKYYILKSELKIQTKASPEDMDLKGSYAISKAKLNGIFGCSYTKIKREIIKYNENFYFHDQLNATIDNESSIEDYYEHFNSCMPYQVGVFTTAWARYELYFVIKNVIGYDAVLYCDTDSAFYKNSPEIEKRVDEYRKKCKIDSEKNGYFVTLSDGSKCYYHDLSPEDDHLKSKTFKALHAKCYALEPDGKLECTIAGVSARNADGTITREQELGSIDDFKEGKTFYECGGTRADYSTIREYEGYTGGGCAILQNTKTIGGADVDILDLDFEEMFI